MAMHATQEVPFPIIELPQPAASYPVVALAETVDIDELAQLEP